MAGGRGGASGWMGWIAGAIVLLAAAPSRADDGPDERAAPPIPWQDTGPFAQLFLQLPFEAPRTTGPGELEVDARTFYSSSVAGQRSSDLSVDVSVETSAPTLFARLGLPRGFELQLCVPGAVHSGGFLGRTIKLVDGLFDSANPLRAGRPPRTARFRVLRRDGSGLDWAGTAGGVADPWVGLKRFVRRQDEWAPALAWRVALAVPVAAPPLGSGRFEVGTGLLASWTADATSLLVEADAMIPAGPPITAADLGTRPHFALQLGVTRRFAPWLTGMLQASAHSSPLGGTGLDVVDGTSTYLLAGIALEPSRSTSVGLALVENVLHAWRGADISAVVELGWRR